MRHIAVNHIYIARLRRVDFAAITYSSLPANDNQQMIAWMDMRHKTITS
jgi:hypothetical protein